MDRDSDPVLQDVKKQTQLTTAAGIAVGVVNNQHVQLSEGAKYFLFSTSRPELGPQQPVAYPGILFGGRGGQQIQLRTEDRENGDLGAVAPCQGLWRQL